MKANKKYPGGGLLRGEYSNGGAVKQGKSSGSTIDGLRKSADSFRQSIMSNPGVVSLKKSVKSLPKAGMTAEQKSRMAALRGGMTAMAAQSAGYSPTAMANVVERARGSVAAAAKPTTAKPTAVKPTATTTAKPTTATKPVATATVKPTTATSTTAKPAASASGSFSKAFADARAKGLKEFTWNGKRYTTQLKSEVAAKPQATQTRSAEPIQKMPVKVVTSITKPYFESPTGVMKPSEVRTTEMRDLPIEKMPVKTPTSVQASTDKGVQYFKPGTMAEYLEERRRKMRGQSIAGLMTKR